MANYNLIDGRASPILTIIKKVMTGNNLNL